MNPCFDQQGRTQQMRQQGLGWGTVEGKLPVHKQSGASSRIVTILLWLSSYITSAATAYSIRLLKNHYLGHSFLMHLSSAATLNTTATAAQVPSHTPIALKTTNSVILNGRLSRPGRLSSETTYGAYRAGAGAKHVYYT